VLKKEIFENDLKELELMLKNVKVFGVYERAEFGEF
jgi:hypothetical protein